jgi:hypothetical protein
MIAMGNRPRSALRWTLAVAALVGGGLLMYEPFRHAHELDRYGDHLRQIGAQVRATVAAPQVPIRTRNSRYRSVTYLDFEFHGQRFRDDFACDRPGCPRPGATVLIWVNPNDPHDFVDQYGTLSGNRNGRRQAFGVVGLGMVVAGIAIVAWPAAKRVLHRW